VCIHATNQCHSSQPSLILSDTIHRIIGHKIDEALRHLNPDIRLSAFRSLQLVVSSTNAVKRNSDIIKTLHKTEAEHGLYLESEYWKDNLPYAIKLADKGYISHLLASAMHLTNRLLSESSTLFEDFVIVFLIRSIFLDKLAYPGSVSVKEEFGLQLIEHIFSFVEALQESVEKSSDFQRSVSEKVRQSLVCEDVLNALHNIFAIHHWNRLE